jgi:glycosyltransferase involved in cell wall biosynthesis
MTVPSEPARHGSRPRILVCADYYEPGFRAGGPIRAISAMVDALSAEFEFRIVTRDRDVGGAAAYEGIRPAEWNVCRDALVYYAPVGGISFGALARLVREAAPDLIYLNSMFSRISIRMLILRKWRQATNIPYLVAPRGELAPSALALKPRRKALFLRFALLTRLYDGVVWQASSEHERDHIRRCNERLSGGRPVLLAPEVTRVSDGELRRLLPKRAGALRAVFISRIVRVKNLDGLLRMLAAVRGRLNLDIWGPREDQSYWAECTKLIDALPSNITVRFCGELHPADVTRVLAESDALLLPTHGENFGHVIAEALGAGCPVVISDRTPWRGLVREEAGWDLPLDRPSEFVLAFEELISMEGRRHEQLRDGARRYLRGVQENSSAVEAMRNALRTALAAGGRRPPAGSLTD